MSLVASVSSVCGFSLIFDPVRNYDELGIRPYAIPLICSIGADLRHTALPTEFCFASSVRHARRNVEFLQIDFRYVPLVELYFSIAKVENLPKTDLSADNTDIRVHLIVVSFLIYFAFRTPCWQCRQGVVGPGVFGIAPLHLGLYLWIGITPKGLKVLGDLQWSSCRGQQVYAKRNRAINDAWRLGCAKHFL